MNKAIFVYQTYVNVHESNKHYVCQGKDEQEHQKLLSILVKMSLLYNHFHYIEFDTIEEAHAHFDDYELDLFKEYTRLIINQGMPSIRPVHYRRVITFLDTSLVSEDPPRAVWLPNYYIIPLNDYITLRSKTNDIRLPTLEELDDIKMVDKNIPLKTPL